MLCTKIPVKASAVCTQMQMFLKVRTRAPRRPITMQTRHNMQFPKPLSGFLSATSCFNCCVSAAEHSDALGSPPVSAAAQRTSDGIKSAPASIPGAAAVGGLSVSGDGGGY